MSEEIIADSARLQKGLETVLKCLADISTAAVMVNPIFGMAGSLIRLVLNHVDDEDVRTLKRAFGTVNPALALLQIQMETVDGQYSSAVETLKNQFQKYMDLLEAQPIDRDSKKNDFMESYTGDQNLDSLYDGVIGTRGKPILDVYLMRHSGDDQQTMERLCIRLKIIFCIGLIARMGYAAINPDDDEEELMEDWSTKMDDVQDKIAQY